VVFRPEGFQVSPKPAVLRDLAADGGGDQPAKLQELATLICHQAPGLGAAEEGRQHGHRLNDSSASSYYQAPHCRRRITGGFIRHRLNLRTTVHDSGCSVSHDAWVFHGFSLSIFKGGGSISYQMSVCQ
jgi:hypothetical protein